jgi:hypothetical protein
MEPIVKVTKIKARWHARVLVDGKVHSEMACANREDIGYICRDLLRWFHKLGGVSEFAYASRRRRNKSTNMTGPTGKIWHSGYFLTNRTAK